MKTNFHKCAKWVFTIPSEDRFLWFGTVVGFFTSVIYTTLIAYRVLAH
jgi:hypothetical protein